jgi:hypothetical protein
MPRLRALALCWLPLCALAAGCADSTYTNPVPTGRLYFPTGLAHVDVPGSNDGVLFVANANTDKRFTSGSLVAINLDAVQEADGGTLGLPAFGAPVNGGARQFTVLNQATSVQLASFTGELGKLDLGNNRYRIFVPSRSEGMKFQAVDADTSSATSVSLTCFPVAPANAATDCAANAPTLSAPEIEQSASGVPRATAPYGVAVKRRTCTAQVDCGADRICTAGFCRTSGGDPLADLFVTHLTQVDSPLASNTNLRGYAVRVESDAMTVDASNFVFLGAGATNSAVAGKRWVYLSGRYVNPYPNLLRLVDVAGNALTSGLESSVGVADARGVALGSNEERLYLLGRSPDLLVVVKITDPEGAAPGLHVVRAVPLPNAPNQLKVMPRAGRGDLVAISCSGAGSLVIYDEDVGNLVAQIGAVGLQPFGLDFDLRGAGARLFVSDFNDGRVAIVDLPDLTHPQGARLVAHLGEQQLCLTRPSTTAGCAGAPQ